MRNLYWLIAIVLSPLVYSNEMNNTCVYHPDLPGCSGNNRPIGQTSRVINIPSRWGAIYFNAANWAIGYSENNTEGFRSANKEALASCIKAGGGQNPIAKSGCHMVTQYRNGCGALALGGIKGSGSLSAQGAPTLEEAERNAIAFCEEGKSYKCTIRYSGCSFHPDYRR